MTTLDDAVALASDDSGLAVVSTLRADGSIQASLVNVGKLPHPVTGAEINIVAPWPKDMVVAVKYLRLYAAA